MKTEIEMEVTPRLVAEQFASLDSNEQAQFFCDLADVVSETYHKDGGYYGVAQWIMMSNTLLEAENIEGHRMFMSLSYPAYRYFKPNEEMAGHEYDFPMRDGEPE